MAPLLSFLLEAAGTHGVSGAAPIPPCMPGANRPTCSHERGRDGDAPTACGDDFAGLPLVDGKQGLCGSSPGGGRGSKVGPSRTAGGGVCDEQERSGKGWEADERPFGAAAADQAALGAAADWDLCTVLVYTCAASCCSGRRQPTGAHPCAADQAGAAGPLAPGVHPSQLSGEPGQVLGGMHVPAGLDIIEELALLVTESDCHVPI
jgi:hypothetical protein